MYRLIISVILVMILMALIAPLSFGEEQTKGTKDTVAIEETQETESFAILRDRRARLLEEIPQLDQELAMLKRQQTELQYVKSDIASYSQQFNQIKTDLEQMKTNKKADPIRIGFLERQLKYYQDQLERSKGRLDTFIDKDPIVFDSKIKATENTIKNKKSALATTEATINNLLNIDIAKQNFKSKISIIFAGLVLAVILGFFFIAWMDEKVRQAVFSGQSGIQLLTLFSLVIAIILFGIIGILEGKELAALLGGLSGYILGRVTQPSPSTPPLTHTPQPATSTTQNAQQVTPIEQTSQVPASQ